VALRPARSRLPGLLPGRRRNRPDRGSQSTIDATAENLEQARKIVGTLPLVENIATLIDPPASTLDEPTGPEARSRKDGMNDPKLEKFLATLYTDPKARARFLESREEAARAGQAIQKTEILNMWGRQFWRQSPFPGGQQSPLN
jgi:hypothetical protein